MVKLQLYIHIIENLRKFLYPVLVRLYIKSHNRVLLYIVTIMSPVAYTYYINIVMLFSPWLQQIVILI